MAALTDEWIFAAQEITGGRKKKDKSQAVDAYINRTMAAWRSSHPAYRHLH